MYVRSYYLVDTYLNVMVPKLWKYPYFNTHGISRKNKKNFKTISLKYNNLTQKNIINENIYAL